MIKQSYNKTILFSIFGIGAGAKIASDSMQNNSISEQTISISSNICFFTNRNFINGFNKILPKIIGSDTTKKILQEVDDIIVKGKVDKNPEKLLQTSRKKS